MSQSALAEALGMSFQQVQKYERGANRVSASVLWEMSQTMQVPVGYFFESYDGAVADNGTSSPTAVSRFFQSADGFDLANAYLQLPEGPVRKIVLSLARQLAALQRAH